MKKPKLLMLILSLSLILVFAAGAPAMAATIGLRPAAPFQDFMKGDVMVIPEIGYQFDVELFFALEGENISPAGGIAGYTVDVVWDHLIGFEDFIMDPLYLMTDVTDRRPEKVELAGYNFMSIITDDHVLGTFKLVCLGPGLTDLIPVGHFVDPINVALVDGSYLPVGFEALSISQVPIPGAVWLLGSGLVGLIGLKRRKRA